MVVCHDLDGGTRSHRRGVQKPGQGRAYTPEVNVDEYLACDATALAELVSRTEVSATELLALARQRAAAVDPVLNAIVADLGAVADARAADPGLPGAFAGVPFLIKDLMQEYRGFPTSGGSRALVRDVAERNALVTERFLDAGLVIFGKTNTPEFGMKGVTEPDCWGPSRNPWRTDRTPGGSSGGSGAAVAAGIVPAAGANDGGGSIRIPAACNGLVGLKPGRGLIPYGPQTGEVMFGMVTQGVLSRTVRDSAALYDALIAPNPRAAYGYSQPSRKFADLIVTPPDTLTIGYTTASAINPNPSPDAVAAVDNAVRLLTDLGHRVEEVRPPCDDAALARDFLTIWFAEVDRQVVDAKRRIGARDSEFEADTLAAAELGRASGVTALMTSVARTNDYVQALAEYHERYDYLLTPTLACEPLPVGATATPRPLRYAARAVRALRAGRLLRVTGTLDEIIQENLGWVPYTQLANITGRPAISVPLHWTANGLPLGVQFVGPLGSDGELLRLAAQLELAQPWAWRHPAPALTRS